MASSPDAVQRIHGRYANLMKAFKHSDRRGTGFLQEKELRRLTQVYQVPMEIIERAMSKTFVDHNGLVSYFEFQNNVVRVEFARKSGGVA